MLVKHTELIIQSNVPIFFTNKQKSEIEQTHLNDKNHRKKSLRRKCCFVSIDSKFIISKEPDIVFLFSVSTELSANLKRFRALE